MSTPGIGDRRARLEWSLWAAAWCGRPLGRRWRARSYAGRALWSLLRHTGDTRTVAPSTSTCAVSVRDVYLNFRAAPTRASSTRGAALWRPRRCFDRCYAALEYRYATEGQELRSPLVAHGMERNGAHRRRPRRRARRSTRPSRQASRARASRAPRWIAAQSNYDAGFDAGLALALAQRNEAYLEGDETCVALVERPEDVPSVRRGVCDRSGEREWRWCAREESTVEARGKAHLLAGRTARRSPWRPPRSPLRSDSPVREASASAREALLWVRHCSRTCLKPR